MAKDLTEALRQLTEQATGQTTRQDKTLPAGRQAPAIPARTGSSGPVAGAAAAGIASPLAETAYADRQFYSARSALTPDGLFTMRYRPLKSVKMQDANGSPVELTFAEPPA